MENCCLCKNGSSANIKINNRGGNNQKNEFYFSGNQWGQVEFLKDDNSAGMVFYGEWELLDFFEAVDEMKRQIFNA